jgi:hypothetical protein
VAGVVCAGVVVWNPSSIAGVSTGTPAPARIMLAACGVSLVLAIGLATRPARRWDLLAAGAAVLGGLAVLVAVSDPAAIAALILLLGGLHATRPARRTFAVRMRGPVLAAFLLGTGWLFVHAPGSAVQRAGPLFIALSIAAIAALVPYLQELVSEEPSTSSPMAWTAFFGPPLALALPFRVMGGLGQGSQLTLFLVALVGLGLVNIAWGAIGAWRSESLSDAWRDSFLADWGLALVGLGLGVQNSNGRAAAYLALLGMVLVRLPLYVWSRPVILGEAEPGRGPLNIAVALALCGAAPFAGFPSRLLLLRAATEENLVLAAALLVGMLLWIAHAFRLSRTLGSPSGRGALGIWLVLAMSLVLGLAPGLLLALGHL